MSTAQAEKPGMQLGSFISKMKSSEAPKAEAKTEEKPAPVVEVQKDASVKVELPDKKEAKPDAKVEAKVEEKPKETEKEEKRLKDTQTWANEEHKKRLTAEREAAELKARLERIEQKLDGTFVEPQPPSVEQANADAQQRGRIEASHDAAVRQHGEEFVFKTVWAAESPYAELQASSPAIRDRVMQSKSPVLEAIAVVKEHADAQKYGRTPEEMKQKIEAELRPKITQDILEGFKTKGGPPTATLGNVRGEGERTSQSPGGLTRANFKTIFPHGATRT